MNLRARSVHEAVASQSFRMKATSLGRVPVLQDHSRHPRAPRSETARLLFRASGPPCFQVNRTWIRSRGPATQRRIFSRSLLLEYRCIRRLQRIKPRSFFRQCSLHSKLVYFSECLSKLGQNTLMVCSPISSPTSRGFCTVKRRRFNDLGEMKTCLQSRCSPS